MLLELSILSLDSHLQRYAHTFNQYFRLDICEAPDMTYKMCPRCDENIGCKYWDLKQSCQRAKVFPIMIPPILCPFESQDSVRFIAARSEGAQSSCLCLVNKFFISNAQHVL